MDTEVLVGALVGLLVVTELTCHRFCMIVSSSGCLMHGQNTASPALRFIPDVL